MSDNNNPPARQDGAEVNLLVPGDRQGCIIKLRRPPDVMERLAVIFFMSPRGIGWVEPHYIDDYPGGSPAYHALEGAAYTDIDPDDPDSPLIVMPGRALTRRIRDDDHDAGNRQAVAVWLDWCRREGRTPEEERQRVLDLMPEGSIP